MAILKSKNTNDKKQKNKKNAIILKKVVKTFGRLN